MTGENGTGRPEDRIRQIVGETLQGSPLFLVDLSVRGRKGSQVVDVFIDSDEALDVEALARISREVGFILDTEDVLKGAYNLNVSSPGVDRPLVLPRQFRKNVGRKLKVKYRSTEQGVVTIEGKLASAGDEDFALETAKGGVERVPYTDLVEARVQLPW